VCIVAIHVRIQQIEHDMANTGLPYLDIDHASRQFYRAVSLRTIGTQCR
jgi:hypothetical protein